MKTGLIRDTTDKFYTNDESVKFCISLIKQFLDIKNEDLIIEPSAGNGSFINDIKLLSNNYKFYDLIPEHQEVATQDYLKLKISADLEIKSKEISSGISFNPNSTTTSENSINKNLMKSYQ